MVRSSKIQKLEIEDEPMSKDIVFKGGTKYMNGKTKGNKELQEEIQQNADKYSIADNKAKEIILENIYSRLNDQRKGRIIKCIGGNFEGRFIERIAGKLFLLREKGHVFSCIRTTFTRQKAKKKIIPKKKIILTGEQEFISASPEQKRLIWLYQDGLSKYGNYIGGIDQYNCSGTIKEYYKISNFRKHALVSLVIPS